MSQAKDLDHIYIEAPGLPYVPLNSPSSTVPVFVRGSNVLTTVLGDFQRRPGWQSFEPANPNTVFASAKRIFTWNRWNGDSYVMVANVDGTNSSVATMQVGVDTNFNYLEGTSHINTGVDSDTANNYEFVVSNDTLYFSNGFVSWRYDGTNLYKWGIVPPQTAPTLAVTGTGRTAVSGYSYVYTYGNSPPGSNSAASPNQLIAPFANKQVNVSGVYSADPQVTNVRIFRTTDGGATHFEINQSPFPNIVGTGAWTVEDFTTDAALNTGIQPNLNPNGLNAPGMIGLVWFQNRIWGYSNNTVYFSQWEESLLGIEEEGFDLGGDGNFYKFPGAINALAVCATGLLIFTVDAVYLISGDARDTFIVSRLFNRLGARARNTVTTMGRSVIWLDTSDTLQITDGQQVEELGLPIRPDIKGIDHKKASLAVHIDGTTHWICLLDGGKGVCRVMNLDTKLWQVPWTFGGTAIYSGEVISGVYLLFLGATDGVIYQMTPDAYLDPGGNPYDAEVVTSLFDLSGKTYSGHVGAMEYLSIERDDHSLLSVAQLTDDDPNDPDSVYTDITGNVQKPAMREQGNSLLEDWYFSTQPRGRRISLKMSWSATNEIFRIYSFDFAYSKLT